MHLLSIIICTNNAREDYLQRVLDALDRQTLPKDQWELLLIDNASAEPLSGKYDLSWQPNARHVLEQELGLTPARLRGIREALGDILVFVDDDNLLDVNYLLLARDLVQRYPYLGVIGAANIIPEFETPPAPELAPYLPMLALRQQSTAFWCNNADGNIPWGAGMVVTRQVATEHLQLVEKSDSSRQLDRRGSELSSCGDNEFSWTACKLGLGRGIFPELLITHLIPETRLSHEYLYRLAEGKAFSFAMLRWIHACERPYTDCESTWRMFFGALRRFNWVLAIRHFANIVALAEMPELDRKMAAANRCGIDRAIKQIKLLNPE